MKLKGAIETEFSRDEDGFLTIRQNHDVVKLSYAQLVIILDWLEEGNGINLDSDWNNGISEKSEV